RRRLRVARDDVGHDSGDEDAAQGEQRHGNGPLPRGRRPEGTERQRDDHDLPEREGVEPDNEVAIQEEVDDRECAERDERDPETAARPLAQQRNALWAELGALRRSGPRHASQRPRWIREGASATVSERPSTRRTAPTTPAGEGRTTCSRFRAYGIGTSRFVT